MYGKIFEDIFDSTLSTDGDFVTTYVFMSMIVLADEHGFVHLSKKALFQRLRFPNDFVCGEAFRAALDLLQAPDEESNLPYEDGRRIIPLSEIDEIEDNRGWWIVNYLHYRDKGSKNDSKDQRREYMRNYQRERREKIRKNKDLESCKQPVNTCKQNSPHTDTDTDADTDTKPKNIGRVTSTEFEKWWAEYPKKVKKKTAREIWMRKKPDADILIADVQNRIANDRRWLEGFTPDPTTYLNQERWDDELETARPVSDPRVRTAKPL